MTTIKTEVDKVIPSPDSETEVTIEEMIDLIRSSESIEVIFTEMPKPKPNVIKLQCGMKYCTDIREFKTILSEHSPVQIYIRSRDIDNIIVEWKEFYVNSPTIYTQFQVQKLPMIKVATPSEVNRINK